MGFFIRSFVIVFVVVASTAIARWQTQKLSLQESFQETNTLFVAKNVAGNQLKIGEAVLQIEIADSPAARAQGLSGRKNLSENAGMLFVFEQSGYYNFWMPDMKFSLDIIWIDEENTIIGFAENAPPLIDKKNVVLYQPPSPVKYALEVNAGFVAKHNIVVGQKIQFY